MKSKARTPNSAWARNVSCNLNKIKYQITLFLSIIPALLQSEMKEYKTVKFAGLYEHHIKDCDCYGSIQMYPESDSTLLFYLSKSDTYQIGRLYGRLIIKDNIGLYYKIDTAWFGTESEGCSLKFMFSQNKLDVETINKQGDCGIFGTHLGPDGSYKKTNSEISPYFIDLIDTVYFEKADPNTFELN